MLFPFALLSRNLAKFSDGVYILTSRNLVQLTLEHGNFLTTIIGAPDG